MLASVLPKQNFNDLISSNPDLYGTEIDGNDRVLTFRYRPVLDCYNRDVLGIHYRLHRCLRAS